MQLFLRQINQLDWCIKLHWCWWSWNVPYLMLAQGTASHVNFRYAFLGKLQIMVPSLIGSPCNKVMLWVALTWLDKQWNAAGLCWKWWVERCVTEACMTPSVALSPYADKVVVMSSSACSTTLERLDTYDPQLDDAFFSSNLCHNLNVHWICNHLSSCDTLWHNNSTVGGF